MGGCTMRWTGKKVSVVGLGKSNSALIRYLVRQGASIVARDQQTAEQLGQTFVHLAQLGVDFQLGPGYLDGIEDSHVIFVTPGIRKDVPEIARAREKGIPISNEPNLFFETCRAPIIGVTGSSGKTTTTSLIAAILEAAGHQVFVGGNIGRPLIDIVDEIPSTAWVVLELSSFQLELLEHSPAVAVITNITPNHLDAHGTMDAYVSAKRRIFEHQRSGDLLVLNWDDPILRAMASDSRGRVVWFSRREEPPEGSAALDGRILLGLSSSERRSVIDLCSVHDVKLLGEHNLENVLAACTVGQHTGVTTGTMKEVVTSFTGVAHRLELVREALGIRFYNDSIATSPARAIAGLKSFDQPVWLIAGGYDKKLPFDEFAECVVERTHGVLLIGETAPKIEEAIIKAAAKSEKKPPLILHCDSLETAVHEGVKRLKRGDVLLLSPACASYDMFPNFEVRGERFRKIVHSMTENDMIHTSNQLIHGK